MKKGKGMKTLIIIPAYNEEANIQSVVERVMELGYDYLVINDCSTDATEDILVKNDFNHLKLPINLGIAGVTQAGFKYAEDNDYDCAVCVDGDGQHDPAYVIDMIKEIEAGNDYVLGSRFVSEKKPLNARMIGSRILCFLIRLKTGKTVYDPTSGMRALGRKVIRDFAETMNFCAEPDALCYLLNHGYQVKEIQVEMKEREGGESYFASPFKSAYYMLCEILSILFIQ
jgi:glycosyltransferase involved in cell wall biosynthesis